MSMPKISWSLPLAGFLWIAASAQAAPSASYHKDVEPILQTHCQSCHRPGQIAPMSFLSYTGTRPWAKAMKAAVISGKMPPWFADRNESQVRFTHDPALTQTEIATISEWADAGAPEGDAKDAPPAIAWPEDGWQIKPDVVIKAPETNVPARTKNNVVEWMYVAVPGFEKDTWVSSIEIRPGSRAVTHHVCAWFQPHTPDVAYNVPEWVDRNRDEKGNEIPAEKGKPRGGRFLPLLTGAADGFTCWVPGTAARDFRPYRAGWLVPAHSDIVFQIHYNPNGTETRDQPQIGFTLAPSEPANNLLTLGIQPLTLDVTTFAIPPRSARWQAPPVETAFTEDVDLVWMMPHMHFRGREMTYQLRFPDGTSRTLLSVKNYDYNWQLGYEVDPIHIPKGTKLVVHAIYDNSTNNRFNPNPDQTVYYGDMAWEEMEAPFFSVVVDKNVRDPKRVLSRSGAGGGA